MKAYTKPQTTIVQLQMESMILTGSSSATQSIGKHDEYDDQDVSY